ncbi:MAG: ABC transporter substrate-binding protein [Rhodospirillales bacterium]|nr:ABC transporter substrate-binding protein [Rhodospirillales bacterium]
MRRREFGLGVAGLVVAARARAGAATVSMPAYAVLGAPAMPAGFMHFPFVDPTAPKGGVLRLSYVGTYDSFNPFILRGTAALGVVGPWLILPGGAGAGSSVGHVWESLLTPSPNEAAVGYGHIAASLEMPQDRRWIAFDLRPQAAFSDATPITAADVAFSYHTLLEKGLPGYAAALHDVAGVHAEGAQRVVFTLKSGRDRQLPLTLGSLPVLPSHWFAGRDFTLPMEDMPLGSGPYRVTAASLGHSITFTRNPAWWARDLPTAVGTNNFDTVQIEYFRDSTVAMQAFKAGQIDIRAENIARVWATGYDFPAVRQGKVIKQRFRHHLPTGMQGWAINTRRGIFADPRVRQALAMAYDFEWENKVLFYGQYQRTTSYFSNTDLAATGLPEPGELALLEPFRAELPPALFTEPFTLPVSDASGNDRPVLLAALALLQQAGWTVQHLKLADAKGAQMGFEILLPDPGYERVALPYVQNLRRLGIAVGLRVVDPAQYQHLMEDFEFDMTLWIVPGTDIPGAELRDEWSSAASRQPGSSNVMGAADPAVDALIEKVIEAADPQSLRAAARALDRVLLWRWYMVPGWGSNSFDLAWWNRFAHPAAPIREGIDLDLWWAKP